MIQTQQHSLSDSDIGVLKGWLTSPGADIFLRVVRSEQAFTQAEAAMYWMLQDVLGKEESNHHKAKFLFERSKELQYLLDKFDLMRNEEKPYEFKTATLTP